VEKAELKRWRDGELVCKRVFDVETGDVESMVVDEEIATTGTEPPPRKRARGTCDEPTSTLAVLADWNRQAVQIKTEASERASRLEDELEDATMCTLCSENRREIVFTGCGHLLSCSSCADALLQRHGGTRNRTRAPCPQCRSPIGKMLSCVVV